MVREKLPEVHSISPIAATLTFRSDAALEGLIHHTDRGGQYAGTDYRAVLRRAEIRQSMSRPDNCYDNSFKESFFGTFKTELKLTEYTDIEEALREAASYIRYYNLERKHSALEYLTPAGLEQLIQHPK